MELHHFGPGPTNGDTLGYFPDEKILHTGDFFMNGWFPYFDSRGGSECVSWIQTLERGMKMEVETIIPGHGEIAEREEIRRYIRCLNELRTEVERYNERGYSLEEIKEKVTLPQYEEWTYYEYSLSVGIEAIYEEIAVKRGST